MRSQAGMAALAATLLADMVGAGPAAARPVRVYNNSDFAMIQLQAKPAHAPVWTENLIGKYSLGVGRTVPAKLINGACTYDFLATYDDGHKTQRLAVDVCKATPIEFK